MKKLKFVVPVLAAILVLVAAKPINDYKAAKYSGEQLFRGIFFFQGDIPNQIGAFAPIKAKLATAKPFDKLKEAEFVDRVVASVSTVDKSYFNKLQAAVDSKDNYQIDEALKAGSKLVYLVMSTDQSFKAYTKVPDNMLGKVDLSKYDLTKPEGLNAAVKELSEKIKVSSKKEAVEEEDAFCLAVFVVVALAVWDAVAAVNYGAVVNAAALALVYAAVYAKTVFWPKEAEDMEIASLEKERIINDIANLHYTPGDKTLVAAR